MTSLLIVEDNVILATTIERFLRDKGNFTVAAVVPSAEIALERLRHLTVDLLLVDVALPGMNGIDLVTHIQELYPQQPCLMLSGHVELYYVRRALEAGARGYVLKNDPLAILGAIQQVLAGKIYVSEELRQKLYH